MYQVFLDFLLLHSSPKGHLLGVLVLKVLVGLHRTVQLQLLQHGESQGQRSLVGCHLWGRPESDTTEAT